MRKLVYYVASTVDGFIAREDGTFDCFLSGGAHFEYIFSEFPETVSGHLRETLGISSANRHFDTVLMGRKTHAVGLKEGITSPYPHLKQYLFSRSILSTPEKDVQLVSSDKPLDVVRSLKLENGLDIWLCGGSELAAALFPEIDELILKINPVVIGSGIPLFASEVGPVGVQCLESKVFDNGVVINRYSIIHQDV